MSSYILRSSAYSFAVLCSPLWLMFVLYVFWGRRSFIGPICRNSYLVPCSVGWFCQFFIFSARHQLDTWTLKEKGYWKERIAFSTLVSFISLLSALQIHLKVGRSSGFSDQHSDIMEKVENTVIITLEILFTTYSAIYLLIENKNNIK